MTLPFRDRRQAGQELSRRLRHYARRTDVVTLGLARGGVPVAFEVASVLRVPLDVFVVRKLGVPSHEELAMGAVARGVRIVNRDVIAHFDVDSAALTRVIQREEAELERKEALYRPLQLRAPLTDRTVIVVDDGLATGASMSAALRAVRQHGPSRVIVAVPIAAPATCNALRKLADEVVCAVTPEPFQSVGAWYEDFSQTSDEQVRGLLQSAAHNPPRKTPGKLTFPSL